MSKRLVLSATLFLLILPSAPALAGYGRTGWGMSLAEVRSLYPGGSVQAPPDPADVARFAEKFSDPRDLAALAQDEHYKIGWGTSGPLGLAGTGDFQAALKAALNPAGIPLDIALGWKGTIDFEFGAAGLDQITFGDLHEASHDDRPFDNPLSKPALGSTSARAQIVTRLKAVLDRQYGTATQSNGNVSPPGFEGTRINGITGDQETTRWF